jgi:hypothetical protein
MRLRKADDAEKEARDRLCHPVWGDRLTLDEFLARERGLRALPFARDRMSSWLCEEGGQVVASCESFRMRSFAAGAPGVSYGIASVFTEAVLRGRGHASRMMELVLAELARDPEAQAVILFSEVGASIYQRCGFVARPVRELVVTSEPGDAAAGVDALLGVADLGATLAAAPVPDDPFVVWPTVEQLGWHLERERFYAQVLRRPRPAAVGARAGGSSIVWTAERKRERLVVQLLSTRSARDTAALLTAARRVAHQAGLAEVRLWAAPRPEGAPAGTEVDAADLPMVRPLRDGIGVDGWRHLPHAVWM